MAVEVHQGSSSSSDVVMGLEILVTEKIVSEYHLFLSEISGAEDGVFQIELANQEDTSVDVTGFEITASGEAGHQYVLPNQTISAGGYLVFSEAELGFRPQANDQLFFYTPGGSKLLDAVVVHDRLRGRRVDLQQRWQFPDQPTFGGTNSFVVEPDVVINEIMFHHQGIPETSSFQSQLELVSLNDTWSYRQTGPLVDTTWQQAGFNDTLWAKGEGLFFVETSPLPGVKNTPLVVGPTTYYFRTSFEFTGDPANAEAVLNSVIDDGAVFYLNGVEVHRHNMPSGTVDANTFASQTVTTASTTGDISIDTSALFTGTNVLAVEVHQATPASLDVVFGAQLSVPQVYVEGTSFQESAEEWLELYNRGPSAVDLSGWQLDDAVEFAFEPGTTLGSGEYLVIASNAATLQAKFPTAPITGGFSGRLSNKNERIQLIDNNQNIADEVEYFDKGRWPLMADGRGSSLELKDSWADNTKAEVWAASDETSKSTWQTITYTEIAWAPVFQPSFRFNELLVGLLDEGEVLLDDISVVESPSGAATELMQNGTFESGTANSWRFQGTHDKTRVIVDPENPADHVLHLISTGPKAYLGNRAETTLAGNAPIVEGREYRISFRAKWLTGSPRLHTEFHYNRLVHTTNLAAPQENGTPGAQNTRFESNLGPTYDNFQHAPAVPNAGAAVTVSVNAGDPQRVASMRLWYAVNEGSWVNVAMTHQGSGDYVGIIPGQSASALVQFYVQGTDALGGVSTFPASGPDSRALYRVQDGAASTSGVDNIRILMTDSDVEILYRWTNASSNDRLNGTVIYNEIEVFYNIGVRFKGSIVTRGRDPGQVGFNIRLDPDHLFRGAVEKIGVKTNGRDEILVKHIINHAGGVPARYDDLVYYIRPNRQGNSPAILTLDPYGNDFLDSQYADGADGTVFKMEGISVILETTDGDPESLKVPQPLGWQAEVDLQDLGSDKEQYRWLWGNLNNHDTDDYSGLIAMAQAFGLTGQTLEDAVAEVIDVDQFMRVFAFMSLIGANDAYSQGAGGAPHNINFYAPPDGGKVLALPWDWDDNFLNRPASSSLWGTKNIAKVIERPVYNRLFLGHLLDIVTTTSNGSYMTPWVSHYSALAQEGFSAHLNFISSRANYVLSQLPAQIPFSITTNGGQAFSVTESSVDLQGKGWIDVREIRLVGLAVVLQVDWIDDENWQVTVPLEFGVNMIDLQAINHQGELVGSDAILVNTSSSQQPQRDLLRITELHYHPGDPTPAELLVVPGVSEDDFEFIEIQNAGAQTIDLEGLRFTTGIEFDFTDSAVTSLDPDQFVLVVNNQVAFEARYGTGHPVAGQFTSGKLSDKGEQLVLVDQVGAAIHDFTYSDNLPWPVEADGEGPSLQVLDTNGDYNSPTNWQFSGSPGGDPAATASLPLAGDYDRDGIVGQSDYDLWKASFGSTLNLVADGNGNGVVDTSDYTIWRDNVPAVLAGSSSSGFDVPEVHFATASAAPLTALALGLSGTDTNVAHALALEVLARPMAARDNLAVANFIVPPGTPQVVQSLPAISQATSTDGVSGSGTSIAKRTAETASLDLVFESRVTTLGKLSRPVDAYAIPGQHGDSSKSWAMTVAWEQSLEMFSLKAASVRFEPLG